MSEELPETVRSALAACFGGSEPRVLRVQPAPGRARMSRTARLLVEDQVGTRSTVFAKWPSQHGRVRRTARYSGAYQREVRFYQELASTCRLRLPRAHFCSYDPGTDEFVLLLEDLGGARPGDNLRSSAADVEQVLRAVATLHAQWMDDRRLGSLRWLAAPADPRARRYPLERIARAASGGRFRGDPARVVLSLLGGDVLRPAAGRRTLVHGDLHADQAFFPAGGDAVIVDWQLVRPGNVGLDTARSIILSLSPEDRRRHETGLLEAYREALRDSGGPAYDLAACWEDYRRGIHWSAFVNATAYLAAGDDTEADDCRDLLFERIAAAAADHGLLAPA